MNAYELADKLNEWYNFSHENMCNEAAQMLRQQADRLAELERKHKEEFDYAEKLLKQREEQ
jgi:hypothetical protein